MTKSEIFNFCYPTTKDKIEYWEKKAKEQLKKDGFYSKKVAQYGDKAGKLKI